jgi:Effector Associated Constant Component 1
MAEADMLEVKIETASRLYARTDPAFLEQVTQLRRSLSSAGLQVLEETTPGTKGGLDVTSVVQAVVAGGPGLIALCGVAKLWLKQRGDRIIRLTVHDGDNQAHVIEIRGENVSDESLVAFAKDASKSLK